MRILKESYEEAKRLLSENRDVMDEIAAFLIEKETITGREFMEIFRKAKGIPEPEEETENKSTESKSTESKAGENTSAESVLKPEKKEPEQQEIRQKETEQ